jgi:hypothetical protein
MTRLRELQMFGILPGFQGNVPMEFKEIFPHSNSSGGWLDALDPLFGKIAQDFNARAQADFGPASFVEADGWFSLETVPWLSASSNGVESSVHTTNGDCLGGFIVPTEDEAAARVAAVYASLTTAKPDAVWVYQGTDRRAPASAAAPPLPALLRQPGLFPLSPIPRSLTCMVACHDAICTVPRSRSHPLCDTSTLCSQGTKTLWVFYWV